MAVHLLLQSGNIFYDLVTYSLHLLMSLFMAMALRADFNFFFHLLG